MPYVATNLNSSFLRGTRSTHKNPRCPRIKGRPVKLITDQVAKERQMHACQRCDTEASQTHVRGFAS